MNFHQKFSQNFPTICIFRPNAQKINALFVKFFKKYAKIMHVRYFLKNFFKIFENFLKNLQQIVYLVQRRKNLPHGLLNFF